MILNIDYKFRDDLYAEDKTMPIELLLGVYRGIVYRYNHVTFQELADGTAKLLFDYDILHIPYDGDHTPDASDLKANDLFRQILGNILNIIILDTVDADREDDTTELNPE